MASLSKIGVAIATLSASVVLAAGLSGCASYGTSAQGAGAVVPASEAPAPMPAQNACKNRATCKTVVAPPVGCKGSNNCRGANNCHTSTSY